MATESEHHIWCNRFRRPREGCRECTRLNQQYPMEGLRDVEMLDKYFPNTIPLHPSPEMRALARQVLESLERRKDEDIDAWAERLGRELAEFTD